MATKLNFLSNSLKIFSETACLILKYFHGNVPWVTLFKNCLRNFDRPKNTALVNGGFVHYRDMKKFLKNHLRNCRSDFEIILQECSFGDPFQKFSQNFDPSINTALVNGGFSHYRDMKKFLKNLLFQNCWSDFEKISQEYSLSDPFQKLFAKF